jgi:peroxiredoxin
MITPPTMRSPIRFALIALVAMFLFTTGAHQVQAQSSIPDFKFTGQNNMPFTKSNLKITKPLVVIYFDPDCDHCQKQATWIKSGEAQLKDAQLLWVSFNPDVKAVKAFEDKFFATTTLQNTFVRDVNYKFDDYFGDSQVPTIIVYNQYGKQTARFTEETPVSGIAAKLKAMN